jgi:signal peptidase I
MRGREAVPTGPAAQLSLIEMGRIAGALVPAVFVLVVGASFAATGPIRRYTVASSAMEPTLHCARPAPGCLAATADLLFARPLRPGEPQRGAVVVFRAPPLAEERCGAGGTFIKRVIALGGESWAERNGYVYVDGRRLSEPYVRWRDTSTLPTRRVPRGYYLLMGDNRARSCDSRVWGPVRRRAIVGRGVAVLSDRILFPLR